MEEIISSPCISYCKKDKNGICQGCFRSVEEISNWPYVSSADRKIILDRAKERIENLPDELKKFIKNRNLKWNS